MFNWIRKFFISSHTAEAATIKGPAKDSPRPASNETTLQFSGNASIDECEPDEAIRSCRDLSFSLVQRGQIEEAKHTLLTGIASHPNFADLPYFLGNVYALEMQFEQALNYYRQALALRPDYAEAHCNCGITLRSLNRYEEALESFNRALQKQPDYLDAINNRGMTLRLLKRFDDALICFDQALQLKPDYTDALINRGNTLQGLKQFEEALLEYGRALRFNSHHPDAWYNQGTALLALSRPEEALDSFGRALDVAPNSAKAHHNRGFAHQMLKQYDEALADFDRALQLQPSNPDTLYNEGLCRLLIGDFTFGWKKCEFRWQSEQLKAAYREFAQPLWLGQDPIRGKTLLLHAEQGLGDTIQFCRYAKLAADQGAIVLLEVQPALTSLLADLDGVHMIYAKGEPLPPFDYHCPLLSLPLAFNTKLDSIPANVPYLHADPDRLTLWRTRLGHSTLPRVGVVWSGNPIHMNDRKRSIPLNDFSRIVFPQAQFISLHKEIRESDRALLNQRHDILCLDGAIEDFADTAALVGLMDLVITVDTSVAHLAGAMGKPVWLLLPFNPDWRWLLDRSDSPWYPTARLFRQPQIDDWDSVLTTVAIETQHFIHAAAAA